MDISADSSFETIDLLTESSSNDSLPDLQSDMECIKLNSSSSSAASTPNHSPAGTEKRENCIRRSSRATTSNATKALDAQLHKIKRRTIAKPRRLDPSTLASDVSEKLIEKLYTNKKLTKVKPTNLETIFEEPKENGKSRAVTYVSATKFRRAINFKDHLAKDKQKVQARRKRIKRLFGSAHKLKKVSMEAFMEHLKTLAGDDDAD
ncbi:protein tantalus [Culicoides brevitarsis]|uniref:protein tantalus n=1 Tax=Culicoides brevitarsis TaxID=469753 RepID=UPI00307B303D